MSFSWGSTLQENAIKASKDVQLPIEAMDDTIVSGLCGNGVAIMAWANFRMFCQVP